MKVLVTGAGGFIGDALCRRLAAAGHEVTGTFRGNLPERSWMNIRTVGDLEQVDDFVPLTEGRDAVVHLAARVHMMRETVDDPESIYMRANADVTGRIARAAAETGTERFVFLSSVKVNGEATVDAPFTENDSPAPQDAYGRSKHAAEDILGDIASTSGLAATALRVPLIYGPGVRANFAALLRLCDTPLPLPLDGITGNRRSLLYLGNLTHAIGAVLQADNAPRGHYLLSDGEDISTAGLIRRLRRSLNRHTLRLPVPAGVIRTLAGLAGRKAAADRLCGSLQIDPARFRRDLGWMPPFSVDQGLAATAAWYRATR